MMMSSFDELAKILAGDLSRRQMLGRIAGVVGGTVAGLFVSTGKASADTAANCFAYCRQFRLASLRYRCTQVCANCSSVSLMRTNGSIFTCMGCPSPLTLCSGGCTNTSSDNFNCGGCGITCTFGVSSCSGGMCVPF
jgi:hypothetical protein